MPRNVDPDGPLVFFVRPPDGETMALITEKLSGHFTSARWLPADTGWPELDAIRDEHLRVRAQVADDLTRLSKLLNTYRAEDATHQDALTNAHRLAVDPPEDVRTPPEARAAEVTSIEMSLWSGARVLAEVVDRARLVLARNEDRWLAELGRARVEADEIVREANQRLAEARANVFRGVQMSRWIKAEVEGGPFAGQPAPTGDVPMPQDFDPERHEDAFERRYYEHDRVQPFPVVDDDPLALEPGEEQLIEPLDDELRFGKKVAA